MSAPEPSGAMHAASAVGALRAMAPEVSIDGVGGSALAEAGATMLELEHRMDIVGLVEGVTALPKHVRLLSRLTRHFRDGRYRLAILVDYPGFHLRVAAAAAAAGVPVLYYIAPQVWAWGHWRVRSLRRNVRMMAVVLPFEEGYFRKEGVPAEFVGHPLLDCSDPPSRNVVRSMMGFDMESPVLGVFPGSRRQEIGRIWPTFRETATRLTKLVPGLKVMIAGRGGCPDFEGWDVWLDKPREVLAASDVALCKSGTIALEAAIHDIPMVVAYRMHPITYAVARRAVRVRRVSLVNILAGDDLVPEFIQGDATPEALADSVGELLDRSGEAAQRQRSGFASVRSVLGAPGAGKRVAELAMRMVA